MNAQKDRLNHFDLGHPESYRETFQKGLFTFYREQANQQQQIFKLLHQNNRKPKKSAHRYKHTVSQGRSIQQVQKNKQQMVKKCQERPNLIQTLDQAVVILQSQKKQNKAIYCSKNKKNNYKSITEPANEKSTLTLNIRKQHIEEPSQMIFRKRQKGQGINSKISSQKIRQYCPTPYRLNSRLQKQIQFITERARSKRTSLSKNSKQKLSKGRNQKKETSLPKINLKQQMKNNRQKKTITQTTEHLIMNHRSIPNSIRYSNKTQPKQKWEPPTRFVMISNRQYQKQSKQNQSELMKVLKRFCKN